METLKAITNRKSVRSYNNTPVDKDTIRTIVEAGNMAAGTPMAGKVYYTVISNQDILTQLVASAKGVMQNSGNPMLEKISSNPAFNPIYGAPVAVVISTDKAEDPNTQAMVRANAACAGENMLLAATDLGLGSCYLESPTLAFYNPEMRQVVKMAETVQPQAVIVFGHTDDTTPHADRPENLDNIIYID